MVETITPVVHGGRTVSYAKDVALHALGAMLSAGALGAALGALGELLGAPWGGAGLAFVAAVGLVYAARDALRLPLPVPSGRRQVPEWWRTYFSPGVTAFLYGAGLGVAFFTYLTFGTFLVVTAAAVASGDALAGALLCMPFGLVRGLSVLVASRRAPENVVEALDALATTSAPRLANAAAAAGVGAAALLAL